MKIELTTDHPQSHYGIPVLLRHGEVFGPADKLPNGLSAAQYVKNFTPGKFERTAAQLFCSQWPEGPQIEPFKGGKR